MQKAHPAAKLLDRPPASPPSQPYKLVRVRVSSRDARPAAADQNHATAPAPGPPPSLRPLQTGAKQWQCCESRTVPKSGTENLAGCACDDEDPTARVETLGHRSIPRPCRERQFR